MSTLFPSSDEADSSYNLDQDDLFSKSNSNIVMDDEEEETRDLFTFPISVHQEYSRMKKIDFSNLPNFLEFNYEDHHTFLF